MSSIDSPLAKFNRAEQHLETLKEKLSPLSDINSYGITEDIDNATGEDVYSYSFGEIPPMPDGIELLIGEMLYNFRCSLDHLVWQLILSAGNMPTDKSEFPIFKDIDKYERAKKIKLKGVSNTVVTIIDSLQPCYSTGDKDYWKYLWYLQILSNIDKHRYLILCRRALWDNILISYVGHVPRPDAKYLNVPVENGAVFLRVKSDVEVDSRPRIEILFSEAPPDIRANSPITYVCKLIHSSVDEVFKRLSPHIK
jgi:hypothetical protein